MLRRIRPVALLVAVTASMGNLSNCDRRTPTLRCSSPHLVVRPDTCVVFTNPCGDGTWLNFPRFDGFTLDHDPQGLSIDTERRAGTARSICAEVNVEPVIDRPYTFTYGAGVDLGIGTMYLTTNEPLTMDVHASPAIADPGQTIDLVLSVSSGVPPYDYVWTINGFQWFTFPTTTDPFEEGSPQRVTHWQIALPETAPMSVTVTDARGETSTAPITPVIRMTMTASASPTSILAGNTTFLVVIPHNGLAPYTYNWVPSDTLVPFAPGGWSATPRTSTNYVVTVTDAAGETLSQEVPVTVIPSSTPPPVPTPAASFTFSWDGFEALQLDASASTGDIVSYAWTFSWDAAVVNASTPNAVFFAEAGTTGTITLTVTDSSGATSAATKVFP